MRLLSTQSINTKIALFVTMATFGLVARGQYYVQSPCDYSPMATEGTIICLSDDEVSSAVPLGFTFPFYGALFSECYISSNGFLSFTAGLGNACCEGRLLPDGAFPYTIFWGQEDLDPNFCTDGDITYSTSGAPGSQIFVLSITDVPHYNAAADPGYLPVTVQVQLYEGTGEIKIVTTQWEADGVSTMGLNQDGVTYDVVPGRNKEVWSAFNECISFTIFEPSAADAGVIDITNPVSGVDLTMESVTVTIQNFGFDAISEFPVSYNVDGGAVVTETYGGTIAPFATGTYTFSTMHDFSLDGCYNITAWTSVADDGDEANNSYMESVCNLGPITGTGAMYIYSSLPGSEPWGTTTNTEAMNTIFGAEGTGWTRNYFETVDPLDAFSSDNCFIFLEGSDAHAIELEAFLTANMATIEGWVTSGGKLLLNAAPNEGDGMSFGFGGTDLIYDGGAGLVTAADPGHPIFNGPLLPVGLDFSGSNFSHARISGTDITSVIVETGSTDITLGEKVWGDGIVMFGGMTTNNFHSPALEAANLRANILSYLSCITFAVCEIPSGLFADGITSNDAVLHWNEVAGADQYRVTIQNLATGLIKTRGFYTNMVEITDKLTPLTEYGFRVKTVCYDDLGEISDPSPWYYFMTLGRIGANEDASVMLYPNPNTGTFNLNVNGYENNQFELNVSNSMGQVVYTKSITINNAAFNEQITLDNVAPGMYQISLKNNDLNLNYSIVITE